MNKIQQYLLDHQDEMIALTKQLVNIDSPSYHLAGIQQIMRILESRMKALGMTTYQLESGKPGTVLVGQLAGKESGAPVILSGHIDTVFPVGTAQQRPFKIAGDKMTGPGIFDMKPGIVIGLYAIQALKHFDLIERPLKIIIVSDEEKLHLASNAAQLIAQEAQGGAYGLNLEGTTATNTVGTSNRGGMIIDLTVHGRAAHSGSEPEKGRDAVVELAHKIIQLTALTNLPEGIHVNCGRITGGISENIIPDQATTSLGIRFRTLTQRHQLLQQIRQIAHQHVIPETTTDVTIRTQIDSLEATATVQQLFADLDRAAKKLGISPLIAANDRGSSDAGVLYAQGVPCIDGLGVVGGAAHTDQEFASVHSLVERAALIATLICTKDAKKTPR